MHGPTQSWRRNGNRLSTQNPWMVWVGRYLLNWMGQNAWNCADGEQSEMRQAASHVVQWVWLSALRMGHRTPDFALAALNKWDHPSVPAGSTLSNAAQDSSDLDPKSMLLVRAQFGVQQHPQILFHQAAFPLGGFQHVLVPAFFPHLVEDLAFLVVELHEVPVVHFCSPLRSLWMDTQPLAHQPLFPVWCCWQTCWGYPVPHHPSC